jgi:hypothetical protein
MVTDRVATRPLTRPNLHGGPGFRKVNAALRVEALRQLRWQQREWAHRVATHAPDTTFLIASADRTGLNNVLDLLREAGEDVPPRFYQRGSLILTTNSARGTTGSVRLASLLADIARVLAWFDPEPSALGQGVSTDLSCLGVDADQGPGVSRFTTTNPERAAPCDRITPGGGAARWTSGGGLSRPVGQGGGDVNWKAADEGHDAAAGEWSVGDRVTARTNEIKVRTGSRGTVVSFSSVGGHPLVNFAGSGLVLIRAEHLERDGDAPPEAKPPGRSRSSSTTRLSDTPRPPAVAAALPPPLPDWFDLPPQLRADENHASASVPVDE